MKFSFLSPNFLLKRIKPYFCASFYQHEYCLDSYRFRVLLVAYLNIRLAFLRWIYICPSLWPDGYDLTVRSVL